MICVALLHMLLLLGLWLPGLAAAVTRSVIASGGATSGTCPAGTPCTLTYALSIAVAGDEVVLADGTYSGNYVINGNSGTSDSNRITLRAANRHQAILVSPSPDCQWSGNYGLYVLRSYWTIQDIRMRQQTWGIYADGSSAHHITIQDNIIEDYRGGAIQLHTDSHDNLVQRNVLGHSNRDCYTSGPVEDHGLLLWQSDNNQILNNIIMGTGNLEYQCGGPECGGAAKTGYGVLITFNSDDNLAQGNLLFANQGKGVFRFLSDQQTTTSARNIARDNAFLWGEGGTSSDDCSDDSNQYVNNLAYGNLFQQFGAKGNFNAQYGHHIFRHNTGINTAFSRANTNIGSASGGACGPGQGVKIDNIFQNNLLYSEGTTSAPTNLWVLAAIGNQAVTIPTSDHNLFWSPSAHSTWTTGYTYHGTDIHTAGSGGQPIFTNAAQGDFSLHTSSPVGRNAATDGTDIGIEYNTFLKKTWLANAFALPTQEHTGLTGVNIDSFTGLNTNKFYQVWFYVPNSPCGSTAETFTMTGNPSVNLTRNISGLGSFGYIQPGGPARYITLGRHKPAATGTLTIDWATNNCVERLFIRELPTADEAYTWITEPTIPAVSGSAFRLLR